MKKYTLILLSSLLSLTSCSKKDEQASKENSSVPHDISAKDDPLSQDEKKNRQEEELRRKEILEWDVKISEVVKDIEYNKKIKYPSKYYFFKNNKTFMGLARKLVNSANGDYQASPSKFLRDEYQRIKNLNSLDSIVSISVRKKSYVHSDTKGSGYKFDLAVESKTVLPLEFRVVGDIISLFCDEVYTGSRYVGLRKVSGRDTHHGGSIAERVNFEKVFNSEINNFIVIWDRARGEKHSGGLFSRKSKALYTGKVVDSNLFQSVKRVSAGWTLANTKSVSLTIN